MSAQSEEAIAALFHGGVSDLVFWSFRYFLGRRTIATTRFAEELATAWRLLTPQVRTLIKKELETEFKRDNEMRADPRCSASYYPLGDDCDRVAWLGVLEVAQRESA